MKIFSNIAILAALTVLCGCESTKLSESYNVQLRLADSLRDDSGRYPKVDVFIKGVSEFQRQRDWSKRGNIVDYPEYRDADISTGSSQVLALGGDKPPQAVLPSNSAAWKIWTDSGATSLIVIANFPRTKPSGDDQDRRMLILPLDRSQYPDNNLQIDVTQNGLDLRTPPRPHTP